MADWTASMQQTFEFYTVDPHTWADGKKLETIKSGSITRDLEHETLGNARFVTTDPFDECYVRVYLITIQNDVKEKFCLGTFLCQSPGRKFNGKVTEHSLDAYTPLIELKEKRPQIGYSVRKNANVLDVAGILTEENVRAPVIEGKSSSKLITSFVANINDTWLTFLKDLLKNAEYGFALDELGRILFEPDQDVNAMQPVWTYDDGNSSILQADVSVERDLYNMPNVVEVVYSKDDRTLFSRVVNNDKDSLISTVNRGREIVYREQDPEIADDATQAQVNSYARKLLREKSSLEYTVEYTHGYCPVRLGDCVLLNYRRAGLNNIRARVTRQSIDLTAGCQVSETAVYSTSLWE